MLLAGLLHRRRSQGRKRHGHRPAARRRLGLYARPSGQKVCILDPFGEVELPASLKARYNPLDAIDPESDFAVDDAGRVAAALVVVENRNDPYWEEAARNLIKGLILHVLSAPYLRGRRNLVTVRRLLTQGDWLTVEKLAQGRRRRRDAVGFRGAVVADAAQPGL